MPKENISRAISKSEIINEKNYENLRYEGFGPFNSALIIETLTDNKNRSASISNCLTKKRWQVRRDWINRSYVQKLWCDSH